MDFVFAYITTASRDEAATIGKALVEERFAACVNIIDGMTSIYRWEGKINTDSEAILIAKTSSEKFPLLAERVKRLHSSKCPCIVSLPVVGGTFGYLGWLEEQVKDS